MHTETCTTHKHTYTTHTHRHTPTRTHTHLAATAASSIAFCAAAEVAAANWGSKLAGWACTCVCFVYVRVFVSMNVRVYTRECGGVGGELSVQLKADKKMCACEIECACVSCVSVRLSECASMLKANTTNLPVH